MSKILFLSLVFSFFSTPIFANDDLNTRQVMEDVGTDLDIAESSLRIILNKPASGRFDEKTISPEARVAAAMALLGFEMKHPGHLRGLHGDTEWPQYNTVLELFKEASTKYQLNFTKDEARAPQSQKSKTQKKK